MTACKFGIKFCHHIIPVIPFPAPHQFLPSIPTGPSLQGCGSRMVWHWMSLKSSKTWNRRCLCTLPRPPGASMSLSIPLHATLRKPYLHLYCDHLLLCCPLCVCSPSRNGWSHTKQSWLRRRTWASSPNWVSVGSSPSLTTCSSWSCCLVSSVCLCVGVLCHE